MSAESMVEVPTAHGPAAVHLHAAGATRDVLVLGHGAGGGVGAPDLQAATGVALDLGLAVALVEQPYRVAGRRSPAPAHQLDAAWTTVCAELLAGRRIVTGGRSSGARVACRTATATGAAAVLCLAFPLRPPGRPGAPSRLGELKAPDVPVLVVQGRRDPFGMPRSSGERTVVRIDGDHGLKSDLPALRAAVARWLETVL